MYHLKGMTVLGTSSRVRCSLIHTHTTIDNHQRPLKYDTSFLPPILPKSRKAYLSYTPLIIIFEHIIL